MKKISIVAVELFVIYISLYCFFTPTVLTSHGYSLAIDGAVTGRTLCLLFALFRFVKLIYFISCDEKKEPIKK
ncbi:hypothetical protein CLNEO_01320 [Anaerotignum neopropionicum]|uniref:Uncharacterized protein n=1 Tax=Anaerotignum neopropionicum TaxID=36847 RepID=A0A136WHJ1_9FIRM|nr:hypothetical protein [Anaerotignum neopropionicum]KXL54036.1 hypothetical protein CLNEO_01320 [Anaerotignum neopropionicum]